MKKQLILCGLMICLLASGAYADKNKFYLRGGIGPSWMPDVDGSDPSGGFTNTFDTGIYVGLATGYIYRNFMLEAEFSYLTNDFDQVQDSAGNFTDASGDITGKSLLFNCFYTFPNKSAFTPFAGAGIGVSKVDVNDLQGTGWPSAQNVDDTVFAWQISAGVAYALDDRVSIDGRYRYFATEDPEFDGPVDYEYQHHNLIFSIVYRF